VEGGLDIKDLATWNTACISRNIWNILFQAGSIWVAWVTYYRRRKDDIWQVKSSPYHSWAWRRILKV
ncbi:hypothetical protein LINPERHAP1_LOCUS38833, partial [Linum perenne]